MTLEQLRALLKQKSGLLDGLQAKAFGADGTDDDLTALETALKEIEDINRKIDLAEKAVAVKAAASVPAQAPAGIGYNGGPTMHAQPAEKVEGHRLVSFAAAAVIKTPVGGNPYQTLANEGFGFVAQQLWGAQEKAVNTLVSSDGGVLVPTPAAQGGIMPILRGASTFLDAGPVPVQLINGQFSQARGLAGSSASYVAEGALKPVSSPTFDTVSMRSKKLAGIVPLTNEARKWMVPNIEAYVREDLRTAMSLTMDLNAWLGSGSGASPLGILNKSGVQTYAPTFASATAPTLVELDRMATGFILKMTTANLFANAKWRWVMSYRTPSYIADMRDGNGNKAFPTMEGSPTDPLSFKGIPVIRTTQLPVNGGAGTDETTIALVDFSQVLFGEEEGITVKMTDQATLNTTGATNGTGLVHLFQSNMFAILAESEHDFGLRTSLAVVKATAIRF
jgi:HK97 family phage major capsid protein